MLSARQWPTRLHTLSTSFATNQLFRLPIELVIEILLQLNIPSLTRFHSLNCCTIQLCQGRAERERSDPEWSGVTPEWKGFDNKSGGTTLASACVLCLDRLSRVWLHISGGLNCCQESWRGVV